MLPAALWFDRMTDDLFSSTEDDNALRAKVDEALSVYDDYMKSRPRDEGTNGPTEDDGARDEAPEPTPA